MVPGDGGGGAFCDGTAVPARGSVMEIPGDGSGSLYACMLHKSCQKGGQRFFLLAEFWLWKEPGTPVLPGFIPYDGTVPFLLSV